VQYTGKAGRPTALLLAFSGALDPAVASGRQHYAVYTGAGWKPLAPVLGAAYDPVHQTVLLRLGKLRNRKARGTLVVRGLTDTLGRPLDGQPPDTATVPIEFRHV
jgi:hypothetical protein